MKSLMIKIMEKELNIAAILKDKPKGLKLWSDTFGVVTFEGLSTENEYYPIRITCDRGNYTELSSNGHYFINSEDTLPCIVPSKSMRDWSKFAWKKGDVLVNGCGFMCIFKEWAADDYTKFNGCYSNSRDGYEDVPNAETIKYNKVDHNTAYGYIREIEKKLGGIFNTSTLKIEKPQFKDGDIVFVEDDRCIVIFKRKHIVSFDFYACLSDNEVINYDSFFTTDKLRPATDSEKQQLFSALEKEGKAWDAEKKAIVDLPKKCELKPFDKVLVRETKEQQWRADLFSHYDNQCNKPYCCIGFGLWISYCIPYNDQTAHLLGTTDDWKGGEG